MLKIPRADRVKTTRLPLGAKDGSLSSLAVWVIWCNPVPSARMRNSSAFSIPPRGEIGTTIQPDGNGDETRAAVPAAEVVATSSTAMMKRSFEAT